MESSAHNDHDLPRQNHLRRNARLRRARSDLPSTSVAILNTGMAAEDKSTRLKSSMTIAFIRPLGGFGARRPRTAQVRSFLHWKPQRTRKRTRRGYLHLYLCGAGILYLPAPAQCSRTAHRERTAVLPDWNPPYPDRSRFRRGVFRCGARELVSDHQRPRPRYRRLQRRRSAPLLLYS